MGNKAGFSKGTIIGKRAKIGGKQIPNSIILLPRNFEYGLQVTQSGVLSSSIVKSGVFSLGWRDDAVTGDAKVTTTYLTPSNLPSNCKTEIGVVWVSSGITTGSIVFDVDYRVTSFVVSGALAVTGVNYTTSGAAMSNATVTYSVLSGVYLNNGTTGLLQKSIVTIPASDTRPNSLVVLRLYRDTDETTDTMLGTANLILAEVSFVDA